AAIIAAFSGAPRMLRRWSLLHRRSVWNQRLDPFGALHAGYFPGAVHLFEMNRLGLIPLLIDVLDSQADRVAGGLLWIADRDALDGGIRVAQIPAKAGYGRFAHRLPERCRHRTRVTRQVGRHVSGAGGIEHGIDRVLRTRRLRLRARSP